MRDALGLSATPYAGLYLGTRALRLMIIALEYLFPGIRFRYYWTHLQQRSFIFWLITNLGRNMRLGRSWLLFVDLNRLLELKQSLVTSNMSMRSVAALTEALAATDG